MRNHPELGSPSGAPFSLDLTKYLQEFLEIWFSQDVGMNIAHIFLGPGDTEKI